MAGPITWRVALAGADDVKRSLAQIGATADAGFRRVEESSRRATTAAAGLVKVGNDDGMVRQLDRASAAADRAAARYRQLADQIARAQSASPIQARINAATGVGAPVYSAQTSAATFVDLAARSQALIDSINPLGVAERKMGEAIGEANALLSAGAIAEAEHAAAVAKARKEYQEAERALKGLGGGMALTSMQGMELVHSVRAVADSIIAGASPVRALALESGRLGQVLAEGPGGVSGGLATVGRLIVGPLGLFGALAVALGTAALSAYQYAAGQEKIAAALQGSAAASGATVQDINAAGEAAARASDESVKFGTTSALAFASTGRVASTQLAAAAAVVRDFAAATGQDADKAAQELAKAFADPAKGAAELNGALNLLSAAELEHIRRLQDQGDRAQALTILLDTLRDRVDGAAEHMSPLSKAVHGVATAFSDAWQAAGKFFDRLAGGGDTDAEAIARLQRQRAQLVESDRRGGIRTPADSLARIDSQIAEHQANIAHARGRRQAAQEDQRSNDVRAAADALDPQARRMADIQDRQKLLRDALKDPALLAKAGLTAAQARGDIAQGDRELKSLRDAQTRDPAAKKAEEEANKRAAAERATESATSSAAKAGLQAQIQIAAARSAQAKDALRAAAEDTTISASERASRIAEAAAVLKTAQAGGEKLKLQLAEIEEQRRTAVSEAQLNRQLSAAQKQRVIAAANAAAAARTRAAREENTAERAQAEAAARNQAAAFQRQNLQRISRDPRQSMGARISATVQLQELERQAAQAELEATLAARGVSKETAEAARKALRDAQKALNDVGPLYDMAWARAAAGRPPAPGETPAQAGKRLQDTRAAADAFMFAAVRANQVQADAGDPANRAEHEREADKAIEDIRFASATRMALEQRDLEQKATEDRVAMERRAASEIEGAFHDLIFGGNFSDFGRRIADDLLEAVYERLIGSPLRNFIQQELDKVLTPGGGISTGGIGSIFSDIASFLGFGGGQATVATAASAAPTAADLADVAGLFADGGKIVGPGGPTDDRILAAVSNGEFVVNAAAAAKYGRLLELINNDRVPRFADGGRVGGPLSSFSPLDLPSPAPPPRPSLTFAPVVHAQSADATQVAALRGDMQEMWRQFQDYARNDGKRFVSYAQQAGLQPFRF